MKVFYAAVLDPGQSRVAARLADGTPFLADKELGEGHVVVLTSGLENLTNDLPLHPVFVAFVDRLARYLSGSDRLGGSRLVDSFVQLRSAGEPVGRTTSIELIDPDGRRPLSLTEARTAQSFRLEREGFYQIRFANGRDALIAVNPDRRESDLEPLAADVQQLWSGSTEGARSATSRAPVEAAYQARSLWWYVMLLALLVALAEVVCQRLHGHAAGGSMSYQSELSRYITKLQKRLRLGAWLRGAAIFAGTALIVTVLLVLLLNRFAFPAQGVTAARLTIFVALAVAAVFGIAVPLIRVTRRWAVENAEAANPAFQQRLTTFEERVNTGDDPFLELLAADTLLRTRDRQPSWLVPDHRLLALGGAGLATLAVLLWIVVAGPGYLGYGASLLWTKPDAIPLYAISVTPGNVIVRRNSDQLVTAQVTRLRPGKAQLFARYESSKVWEPAAMQAAPDTGSGANFQFVFAGLPEDVEYYVIAGPLVSSHFKVRVMDLPSIKDIRVTYHYPAWTGMKPVTERNSGDLRAIEGTDAAVEIKTDRPLNDGQLSLDNGQVISLAGGADNTYTGSIRLEKDGAYHLAQTGEGQQVRLSEDYFIATDKALPPEISIDRPGGDYRASPIEEVTMGVKAADPFGLHELHLHYSVNGGPNQDVDLLKTSGVKSVDGSYTLPLEDYALVPGDVVSLYATARDGHSEARTDIAFIQIEPFEREFSQSQQNGGGSGGGANRPDGNFKA